MARMVNTVLGPVSTDKLGGVLPHEHFLFGFPGFHGDYTMGPTNREEIVQKSIDMMNQLKPLGINTILDATPNECGRDVSILKEISERTETHIILVTGYYYEGSTSPHYMNFRKSFTDVRKEIAEMMMTELTVGIEGTGVKAGAIKLASSLNGLTDFDELFFSAACQCANDDPNTRIITHTEQGTFGKGQVDYFLERGVNPKQVAIGHMDGTTNMNELLYVAEKGFWLSLDRFGIEGALNTPTDEQRMVCVAGMVAAGYGEKMMLSHDFPLYFIGRPVSDAWNPKHPWKHLFADIYPRLEEMGISKQQIHDFNFTNPQSFFGNIV